MKEILGVVTSAKYELSSKEKRVFVARLQPDDGDEWRFYIFDKGLQKACENLVDTHVVAVAQKSERSGMWELVSIEESDDTPPSGDEPTEKADPYARADKSARQRVRSYAIESAAKIAAARPDMTAQDVVVMAEIFESYVFSPTFVEIAEEMASEALNERSAEEATKATKGTRSK